MEQPRENGGLLAWIDGRIVAADRPGVPALDQAFLTGMGAFETMRAENGRVLFLDAHHARLSEAAGIFGLEVPPNEVIAKAATDLMRRQDLASARVRVAVSGTGAAGGSPFRFGGPARVVVIAFPLTKQRSVPARMVTTGIRIHAAGPLAGRKCSSYALHALAFEEARSRGADEALMLNHRGELCGGAVSNLFWVSDGQVMTPALKCGCRNGVTRERVIEACGHLGIATREVVAKRGTLDEAEEVFFTSSIRGLRRVEALDDRRIGNAGLVSRIRKHLSIAGQ